MAKCKLEYALIVRWASNRVLKMIRKTALINECTFINCMRLTMHEHGIYIQIVKLHLLSKCSEFLTTGTIVTKYCSWYLSCQLIGSRGF